MAVFKDLDVLEYFPLPCDALVGVGWLGREAAFERGEVTGEFFDKLSELTRQPWQPALSAGLHFCEFCQFNAPGFSNNLFVPYEGKVYVSPVGICHYVAAHWYRPPAIFIDAVMACPPMSSMEYLKALLKNGGRELIRKTTE